MEELKIKLLDMINTDNNIRYSYMALEKLITIMLKDYIESQGKKFIFEHSHKAERYSYDACAPDGFDQFIGKTVFEFKFYRSQSISNPMIRKTIEKTIFSNEDIENLIIVFVGEVSNHNYKYLENTLFDSKLNVFFWNIDDLIKIFSKNIELFNNTYSNLNTVFVKDTINQGIRNTILNTKKHDDHITKLAKDYKNDKIVLFLGAGVSKDAGVATWNTLVSKLFVALVDNELSKNGVNISDKSKSEIVKKLIEQNNASPLLQARFLRQGFANEFERVLRETLYENAMVSSDLLKEIVQLCVPNRGKTGIQAIINYNFDDLVEQNLQKNRVKYSSIYNEGMVVSNDELGIYHVHGFLPKHKNEYKNLAKSLLVFSEEGYHKLMLEPYNWANITQLNYLINNTCIFIGLSMTDPNLRRLLEISAQKHIEGEVVSNHYAIMKRIRLNSAEYSEDFLKFENVNESIQESMYRELGVNIIWIDDYKEIPAILKKIKDN